jgi:hypothetical protein
VTTYHPIDDPEVLLCMTLMAGFDLRRRGERADRLRVSGAVVVEYAGEVDCYRLLVDHTPALILPGFQLRNGVAIWRRRMARERDMRN